MIIMCIFFTAVRWLNSSCLGAADSHCDNCLVSLVCAPGHSFANRPPEESATLSALITRYMNEVLHNICCTRLFVWEQVLPLGVCSHR